MTDHVIGTSSSQADWVIKSQIKKLSPLSVVDFGAGAGKNCQFVRDILGNNVHITAIDGYRKAVESLTCNWS